MPVQPGLTHAMRFARDVFNRVRFFDEGRIRESGPPEPSFTEPRPARTRESLYAVLSLGQRTAVVRHKP